MPNLDEKLKSDYYRSYESLWPSNKDPDYDEKRQLYSCKKLELDAEFKKDLFEEHGVTDKDLAERMFHLAWEKGHASGHGEVALEFSEIASLFKGYRLIKEDPT